MKLETIFRSLQYYWDFGDGDTAITYINGLNPTNQPLSIQHLYQSADTPTVFWACVTMVDGTGCTLTKCRYVIIPGNSLNTNCSASFSYATDSNGTVNFAGVVSGSLPFLSTVWDFGDNSNPVIDTLNTMHTYTGATGFYEVCLTTVDSTACIAVFCDSIWHQGDTSTVAYCDADFYYYQDSVTQEMVFVAAPSSAGPYLFAWDFGDTTISTTASFLNYALNDTSVVCLTITDGAGCVSSFCDTIVVDSATVTTGCTTDFWYQVNNSSGTVSFNSQVYNTTGAVAYLWTFGDGDSSTAANPVHVYTTSGNYLVTLITIDANGCQGYTCVYVSVQVGGVGYTCNADFSHQTTANGTAYFYNTSTGLGALNYAWDFGDGFTAFNANPFHTYSATGYYQVCLGLTDATGCQSYYCDTVFVQVPNVSTCSVDFIYQINPTTGVTTFAPTNLTGTAPFIYNWNFGDGTTSSNATPAHLYTNTGSITACLTVTDANGCQAAYCDSIVINNGGACFSAFTYTLTGNTVTVNAAAFGVAPISYIWYLGDGTLMTGSTLTHTYNSSGIYSICLTTIDGAGCVGSSCQPVMISPAGANGCLSDFTYQANTNGTVNFAANPINGVAPFTYQWNFGDGTSGIGANPTHTYNTGAYGVYLTVIDSTGCSFTAYDTVSVQVIGNCSVDMNYYLNTNTNAFNFTAAATGTPPFAYNWSFGDGTSAIGQTANHTYSQADSFQVCVIVIDATGCFSTDCNVINAPDTASAACNATFTYQVQNNGTVSFFPLAGMLGAPILYNYYWNFGNGATATLDSPIYTYTTSGNYLVSLTITDSISNCTDTYSVYVSVQVGGVSYNCYSYFTAQDSGSTVFFNGMAGGGIAPYTYAWDFGNGTTSTAANPTYNYVTNGVYMPCLTVTDATGCVSSSCDTIYVGGQASNCYSYFTAQDSGFTVFFNGMAGGGIAPYTYAWDFGNGTTSTAANPTYNYVTNGVYMPCLTVTDATGCMSSSCDTIYVGGQASNCNVTFLYQQNTNGSQTIVTFNSSVTGGVGAYTYSWDFGDGGTSSVADPIHTYTQAGIYTVCVTAIDATGCVSTNYCLLLNVQISACQAGFTYTHSNTNFRKIYFTNTSNSGAGTTWSWNFGDGITSIQKNPIHTYTTGGYYSVCLTMTKNGCTDTYCDSIFIAIPCNVELHHWSDSINTPQIVNFQAFSTGGYMTNGVAPFTYYWDFGDGDTAITSGINVSHNYTITDTFVYACLTVIDATGCTATDCEWVYVGNPDTTTCAVDFQFTTYSNGVVNFSATPSGFGSYDYIWDMGDGMTRFGQNPNHAYSASGDYMVCVTMTDSITNCSDTYCDTVNIPFFTSTTDLVDLSALTLFPNPVRDELNIKMSLEKDLDLNITIMSATGQVIRTEQKTFFSGKQLHKIMTGDLSAGVYMLHLRSETGVKTERFVVVR